MPERKKGKIFYFCHHTFDTQGNATAWGYRTRLPAEDVIEVKTPETLNAEFAMSAGRATLSKMCLFQHIKCLKENTVRKSKMPMRLWEKPRRER